MIGNSITYCKHSQEAEVQVVEKGPVPFDIFSNKLERACGCGLWYSIDAVGCSRGIISPTKTPVQRNTHKNPIVLFD